MGIFFKKKTEEKKAPVKAEVVKDEKKKDSKNAQAKKEVSKKDAKTNTNKKQSMKDLYGGSKPAVKAAKTGKTDKKATRQYGNAYRILVRPLITEKAANQGQDNKYMFAVTWGGGWMPGPKTLTDNYSFKDVEKNYSEFN